jgi:hypothetical protein
VVALALTQPSHVLVSSFISSVLPFISSGGSAITGWVWFPMLPSPGLCLEFVLVSAATCLSLGSLEILSPDSTPLWKFRTPSG